MGTDYNYEIGYETLQKDFKRYQKETPKGVSLQNKRNKTIVLKFKIDGKEKSKGCNCSFTLDGMVDALKKAHKVAEKLKTCSSIVEFDKWYDETILEKNKIVDDRLTFGEAIKKVEDDFWSRASRTKRARDKSNHSDLSSWHRTYGCFYQQLPQEKIINLADILAVINKQKRGSRNYMYVVSAMKKLTRVVKRQDILDVLGDVSVTQTEKTKLQTVTLEQFLAWREKTIGLTAITRETWNMDSRKAWLWAFSMQVVYGLRLSEVFAIANLTEPLISDDGVPIPALNDPSNTGNIIFIKDKTNLNTTVKTGFRMSRPNIPPKYPDLIERLDIKTCRLPSNRPTSSNPLRTNKFYTRMARQRLVNWDAPFTQTHALRHLANINGIQAGIPQEVRAQSLGHTVQMNESVYKKRQSTQTTIDLLLNSNQNAIDFVTALGEAKKLARANELNKEIIAQLLSIIYQKNANEISNLLV
jgi:integrase